MQRPHIRLTPIFDLQCSAAWLSNTSRKKNTRAIHHPIDLGREGRSWSFL